MSTCITPAPPWANRGPPTRVAALTLKGALRTARGPLLVATGTGYLPRKWPVKRCKVDARMIK
jgi:hypothetical protein